MARLGVLKILPILRSQLYYKKVPRSPSLPALKQALKNIPRHPKHGSAIHKRCLNQSKLHFLINSLKIKLAHNIFCYKYKRPLCRAGRAIKHLCSNPQRHKKAEQNKDDYGILMQGGGLPLPPRAPFFSFLRPKPDGCKHQRMGISPKAPKIRNPLNIYFAKKYIPVF